MVICYLLKLRCDLLKLGKRCTPRLAPPRCAAALRRVFSLPGGIVATSDHHRPDGPNTVTVTSFKVL